MTMFTLSQTPSPSTSLAVYRNGLRLSPGVDYTLERRGDHVSGGFDCRNPATR